MQPFMTCSTLFFISSILLCFPRCFHAQQPYIDNKQLKCDESPPATLGYTCNGFQSCASYLTFRSEAGHSTPRQIASLLSADPSAIARINNIAVDSAVPVGRELIVPISCSCEDGHYQHDADYTLSAVGETYLLVANNTYQGLSTCQALMAQNPYDSHKLQVGMKLKVPLRCACPTPDQHRKNINYLLSYLVTWGDDVPHIARKFGADQQAVLDANQLSLNSYIYPFTTLLVPLQVQP